VRDQQRVSIRETVPRPIFLDENQKRRYGMKAEELLKLAKATLEEKRNESERKKETGKSIAERTETLEQYVRGDYPEGEDPSPEEVQKFCRALLAQRKALQKDQKAQGERIRKLKQKLESIILEEGEYGQPELPMAGGKGKKK